MSSWFYESRGNRIGPIPQDELQGLHASGEIYDNTLVWNKEASSEWRTYAMSGLSASGDDPPPLPTTHVNNAYAWALALVPIIGAVIEKVASNSVPRLNINSPTTYVIYFVAYVFLGARDARQIERSGRNRNSVSLKGFVWLAPVYLVQRARALGHKPILIFVWLAAFVGGLAITDPDILKGNFYFGAGMPKCDSGASLSQVKDIFNDIPLVKSEGITALDVTNPTEISSQEKSRSCQATVSISNGNSVGVAYVITDRGDSYYYQVNIQ